MTYPHWNNITKQKLVPASTTKAKVALIAFDNTLGPVTRTRYVKMSMDNLVRSVDNANSISDVRANFRPNVNSLSGTSQMCLFHP